MMAAAEGTTMTVQAMGRLLGLKKTESYYLLHKHHFETVTINHQLRVVRASFEQWYLLYGRNPSGRQSADSTASSIRACAIQGSSVPCCGR